MKTILHTISSQGSPWGLSTWRSIAICSRRAALDAQAKSERARSSADTIETQTGTIYHAFQEVYHSGELAREDDTTCIEFVQDGGHWEPIEVARLKAEELFRGYRARYTAKYLGRVLHIEYPLDVSALDLPWKPAGMPLTGRIDKVVKISLRDSMRLQAAERINLPPGIYACDYKTEGSNSPNLGDRYRNMLQFSAYQLMWNALHPTKKLAGFLVQPAIKSSRPSYGLHYVPPVGEAEERIVRVFLERAYEEFQRPAARANPTACFEYNRPCYWLVTGACPRY
jgi:hypothetical protein